MTGTDIFERTIDSSRTLFTSDAAPIDRFSQPDQEVRSVPYYSETYAKLITSIPRWVAELHDHLDLEPTSTRLLPKHSSYDRDGVAVGWNGTCSEKPTVETDKRIDAGSTSTNSSSNVIFIDRSSFSAWESADEINKRTDMSFALTRLSSNYFPIDQNSTFILESVDERDKWINANAGKLVSLLQDEDVKAGVYNPSEYFVKDLINIDRTAAMQVIIKAYRDNVSNRHIKIGILQMNSHMDYETAYTALRDLACIALLDEDDDVKDFAVQCFEDWEHPDGICILENIHTDTVWLQKYIDDVILALKEQFLREV